VPAQIPQHIPTPQRQAHTNTYEERSPQSTLAALRTLGAAELNALAIPEPSVSSVWHRPWSPVPGEETVKEMTGGSVSFHSGMGESLGLGKDLRSGGPLSLRWETLTKEGMVYSVIWPAGRGATHLSGLQACLRTYDVETYRIHCTPKDA